MLTVIDHEFRYEYSNGEHLGTYIDYKNQKDGSVYYTMTEVNEQEFDKYMKKYGEDLLIQINDAAFDGCSTNYFDFNNNFDKHKCSTRIEGYSVEVPMILFKITDYAPAMASCYYVNNRIIERYKQGLFLHT